ncbi:Anaphase-promoting complex subunit 23 [Nowakowskiella sp. JEL0407]|nr:Anaphase-promoting complex subunit 23 [Nowakowskiella sp. JEL0407]
METLDKVLSSALKDCLTRGLILAPKWLAELLQSLDETQASLLLPSVPQRTINGTPIRKTTPKEDRYLVILQTFLNAREYGNATAHAEKSGSNHPKILFIRLYSLFLSTDRISALNEREVHLKKVKLELQSLYQEGEMDAFLLYLYSAVSLKYKDTKLAAKLLTESINLFPYNWSAWRDLTKCVGDFNEENLPKDTISFAFFKIYSSISSPSTNSLTPYRTIIVSYFKDSPISLLYSALTAYSEKDYKASSQLFQQYLSTSPHSLEYLDTYSDVLYVLTSLPELSALASHALKTNPYCPETNLILANFYSLSNNSRKAIEFLQKALSLDPENIAAWVLLGHEYLELKNVPQAMKSYWNAIENGGDRDYRAWYGLGTAYETLKAYTEAIRFFWKANNCSKNDSRIWNSLGVCYEAMGDREKCVQCFENAVAGNGGVLENTLALKKLGELSVDPKRAVFYFEAWLKECGKAGDLKEEISRVYIFLANFYLNEKVLDLAEKYAVEVKNSDEGRIIWSKLLKLKSV